VVFIASPTIDNDHGALVRSATGNSGSGWKPSTGPTPRCYRSAAFIHLQRRRCPAGFSDSLMLPVKGEWASEFMRRLPTSGRYGN
jgi:hypothetical protein